ncbi:MAG: YceI family protein [Chryseolinea sp.]
MKNNMRNMLLVFLVIQGISLTGFAQSVYKIAETKDIDMKLLGTSTLHKWEMDAQSVAGEAQFVFKSGSKSDLTSLKSFWFALEVKDLKSDSKGLDKNAYKALKSDEFKDIHYKLISSIISGEKENKYLLKTIGMLTIAGVTKEIDMNVHCVVNKDGTITCTGSEKLNMTDYNVKPPTFMLGAMKTGDAIELDFTVVFKKQQGA